MENPWMTSSAAHSAARRDCRDSKMEKEGWLGSICLPLNFVLSLVKRFYHLTPLVEEILSQNHNSRTFFHRTPTFGVIVSQNT
jgi:hypothetical protein